MMAKDKKRKDEAEKKREAYKKRQNQNISE
jgi:hypothetical protein